MKRWSQCITLGLAISMLSACATQSAYMSKESKRGGDISEDTLALNSTVPNIGFSQGVLLTDNDDAFFSKLAMIKSAQSSIDLAYYIISDDHSSSMLAQELVAAAQRGVKVRVLTDLHTNYHNLDYFSMLEREGNKGEGSLEVRFYNRPTKNIIKDAVYVTLGCGEALGNSNSEQCSGAKFDLLDDMFANENIDGTPIGDKNISNLNLAKSGLFLSGLYSKNPNLMALAITQGQGIDPAASLQSGSTHTNPEQIEQLKKLGKIYYRANFTGGFDSLIAKMELSIAFALYGDQINPVFEAFTGFLPVEREDDAKGAEQDWRFLTDFLHHKFLLVDGKKFQLGGRNVENSYHMRENELTSKYVFMDTDAFIEVQEGGNALTESFNNLWNFDAMVARTADVRQFAPNDFASASSRASDACKQHKQDKPAYKTCSEETLPVELAKSLDQRMDEKQAEMIKNADAYAKRYHASSQKARQPQFEIDKTASISYVENLPFYKAKPTDKPRRSYGAKNGQEGESGKHIHNVWLTGMRNTCAKASAENPQRIIIHNAYYFLPSNLLTEFAKMVDGRRPCANVRVDILTNSIETTDLNVVNLLSRHSMRAFGEYYKTARDEETGAEFSFYEYIPPKETGDSVLSLHSKVEVFSDHIFVGSANADVRSYMKDSNNGVFIQNAPKLVEEYSKHIDALLSDADRVTEVTEIYLNAPREQMLQEDLQAVNAIMAKYRAERWIKEESQLMNIENVITNALDRSYDLSMEAVTCKAFCDAPDKFNMMFKTI